jgi:cell division protein FtsB
MAFGRELKRRVKGVLAPLLFLSLVGYFAWNATKGDHGLLAYAQRQHLLKQAQDELARTQREKLEWERRVSALRSDRLDADILDERARAMLNLSDPADIIVPLTDKDRGQ